MMDDDLMKALMEADVTRDPRWDALAAGTLGEADEAELRALAQASPEGRAVFDAFRPIEEHARAEVADRIAAAIAARRRRRRFTGGVVGAALAMAAACAILVARPSSAPLPGYEIATRGGEQEERGEAHPPVGVFRFGPGSRPEITLKPARGVEGKVAVRCFLAQEGGLRGWDPPLEIAGTGAVRIAGERARVFAGVPAGRWEMVFLVGRAGDLPADARAAEVALRRAEGGAAAFQVIREPVILDGEAP